jgi:RNA-directed DNA polymerase
MVRREGTAEERASASDKAEPCCATPTGESPARVIAGEPGSRVQSRVERRVTERAVKSLERGSNEAGRNQVKAEQASSHYQPKGDWESRAGHAAAKADEQRPVSPDRALGLPGVLAAARFEGDARNTRGPSAQPTSGKPRTYKARAENGRSAAGVRGVHRTDEGGDKPLEGEGPALVAPATQVSARACPKRANTPNEKVRELQRRLWTCAKRSRTRRFHALFDRICRSDVLQEAWRRVRSNGGAAGVDAETIRDIEERGVDAFLENIQVTLRESRYRPSAVRRRYIPKAGGAQRPLGIPTVKDRVVQMATKLVIEPLFEADFLPSSYGFRPKRSALQALEAIREAGNSGHNFVLDADIQKYFDTIDRQKLLEMVKERISDRKVLKLIRQWLEAGVMEDGTVRETLAGTPQGGVISPLLANIYLHRLDRVWASRCSHLGTLVRYADDFVVMCKTQSQVNEANRRVELMLTRLGLTLHPEKTRVVKLSWGKEGFIFLGHTIRKRRSIQRHPRWHFVQRWPSPQAMKKVRARVHELTDVRRNRTRDVKEVITKLNPVLRGWGNYFRSGNAQREFEKLDDYVRERLNRWQRRRGGQRTRFRYSDWPHARYYGLGLHQLEGTVKYPAQATPVRPSLSRMREIRTSGLNGGRASGSSSDNSL